MARVELKGLTKSFGPVKAVQAADIAFETDAAGRFVFVNPDPALGWSTSLLIGQPADLLMAERNGFNPFHPTAELRGRRAWVKRGDGSAAPVRSTVGTETIADLVAAAHLVHVGRVIRDKAHGIMVSPGIDPETQGHLGFEPARSPQQALEMAFAIAGPNAKVVVLRHGGDVLPLISGNGKPLESGGPDH